MISEKLAQMDRDITKLLKESIDPLRRAECRNISVAVRGAIMGDILDISEEIVKTYSKRIEELLNNPSSAGLHERYRDQLFKL